MTPKKKIILGIIVALALIIIATAFIRLNYANQKSNTYYYEGRTGKFSFQITKTKDITSHVISVFTVEGGKQHQKLIPFDYGPKELEGIPLEKEIYKKALGESSAKKVIYITQDPKLPNLTNRDSVLSVLEIAKVTGQAPYSVFKIQTEAAYTYNDGSFKYAEIIDCKYANSKISVILLKLSDEDKIYSDGDCVIVEGKSGKKLKEGVTKLAYHLLGVF